MAKPAKPYNPQYQSTVEDSARSRGPIETEQQDFVGRVSDSYRLGWMGQALAAARVEGHAWKQQEVGFDGINHIPKGYELYADAFGQATSEAEIAQVQHEIDLNLAARARRDKLTFGQTLGADVISGIADPTNLLPSAKLLGVGGRVGALKGGASIGAIGGLQSTFTAGVDPTATREEAVVGTAFATVLGAGIGGTLGRVGARTRLKLPGGAARVTSKFGGRDAPKAGASTNHKGVDIAYPMRTPITVDAPATVKSVTRSAKGGLTVELDLGGGVTSKYLHLDSAAVKPGDRIAPGQHFARTGASGNVTGPHLHWSVLVNGTPVDPLGRVEVGGVRSPGAAVDLTRGVSIPDSVVVKGVDMPVIVQASGEMPAVRNGSVGSALDRVMERMGEDMGGGTEEDRLIADYLKGRGQVTEVPAGRRSVNQRKLAAADRRAAEADDIAAPHDAVVINPERMVEAGTRTLAMIDELEAHPRFNPAKTASKDWVSDLGDEAGYDLGPLVDRAVSRQRGRPLTQARVIEILRWRAQQMIDDAGVESPLVADAETSVKGQWTRKIDDADRELAQQDRNARRVQFDDGTIREIPADRPLTAAEKRKGAKFIDKGPVAEEATDAGHALNRIEVDPDYVYATFPDKPWAGEPLPGGKTIGPDAIQSPGQWFNFTMNRTIAIEELADEVDPADLIPTANARALEEMEQEVGAFVHQSGPLKTGDAALSISPMGQLKRLAPADAEIHRSLHKLGGDGTVLLDANEAGAAAAPGGTVALRQLRWLKELGTVRDSIRRSWLKAMGKDSTRGRMLNEISILAKRTTNFGKDSLDQFRRNVGRAIVGLEDDGEGVALSAAHHEAAATWRTVMEKVEKAAREAGLFSDSKRLAGLAEKAERALHNLETRRADMAARGFADDVLEPIDDAIAEARSHAENARVMAETPLANRYEPGHYSRIWHKASLVENREAVIAKLEECYARAGDPDPAGAAQRAYLQLIADPEGELSAPGTPGFVKARTIPITNAEAWDWIVQDPETVALIYLRRMGASIEMSRMFGDPFGLAEVDRLVADMVEKGMKPEDVRQARQIWEDARDRVAGGFHGADPLSLTNRAAKALQALTSLSMMGGALKSQLSDIGRIIVTQGMGVRFLAGDKNADSGLIGALMGAMSGDLSRYHPGGPAKEAGEALDLIVSRAAMRLIENDDAYAVTGATGIERGLMAVQTPFHVATLLTPMTIMLKELAGLSGANNILRDCIAIADGSASAKTIARMARQGIDARLAGLIASMPHEAGTSGLRLANVAAWLDHEGGVEASEAFHSAVASEVRASVPAPNTLDKPAVADGIFHTDKGRLEHQEKMDEVSGRIEELRGQLAVAFQSGADAGELLDALKEASGELAHLKRNRGRAGRVDYPLAKIPFFLRSYGMGAGKSLHGLLTGRERNIVGGTLSLLMMGYLSWRWKTGDKRASEASILDTVGGMVDNSGIGAWIQDAGKTVDTLFNLNVMPGNAERDPDGETVMDEAGAVSPAITAIQRLIAPLTADNQDDRAHAIRQAIPLQNAFYLSGLFDTLEDAIDGVDQVPQGPGSSGNVTAPSAEPIEFDDPATGGNGIDHGRVPPKPQGLAPIKFERVEDIEVGPNLHFDELSKDLDKLLELFGSDRDAELKKKAASLAKKAAKAKGKKRRAPRNRTNLG